MMSFQGEDRIPRSSLGSAKLDFESTHRTQRTNTREQQKQQNLQIRGPDSEMNAEERRRRRGAVEDENRDIERGGGGPKFCINLPRGAWFSVY